MPAQVAATVGNRKQPSPELEQQLDSALQGTFPASDPVAVGDFTAEQPDRPIDRRPAPIDKNLVAKLAREVADRKKGRS